MSLGGREDPWLARPPVPASIYSTSRTSSGGLAYWADASVVPC